MSDEPHRTDSEDEDEDYRPAKNDESSNEQSEEEQNEEKDQSNVKVTPYDKNKAEELWKNFTSSSTTSKKPVAAESNSTTKVFDFAGEKVTVPVTSASLKRAAPSSSGSSSVLDRLGIGKKPKLSTLEKSRLDWQNFKQSESLNDDLESHRRGKDSYVEKKAFLQRTEIRQHDHYLTNVKKK